jgi:two-component system, sensor histidine kinase and response regulator
MANILIVDDTPANLNVLASMLQKYGHKARPAINGDVALSAVEREKPDLILLDINMPNKNGFEVCTILKANPNTADIPVIFISALSDVEDKIKAFEVGGVDYVTKPFNVEEVHARVNAHLQLQEQRREIENLIGFKDDMMRIVSHDLKNPIGVILGYTELILDDGDMQEEYIHSIKTSAQSMLSLVMDLLDLARTESAMPFELKPDNIVDVINESLTAYEFPATSKKIEMFFEQPSAPIIAMIDQGRLLQVVNNFVSNAIKYTPEGGQVAVRILDNGSAITVQVSDSGIGIPKDDVPYVFDRFYRVKKATHQKSEGTGLGLAIAAGIIKKHNGEIGVDSQEGQGSTFYFHLPKP